MANHLFLISVLYAFSGIGYFAIAIKGVIKRNELRIFDFVRLMYSFVYGLIPSLLYWKESTGERNLYFYDYSLNGLTRIYLMWFLSIAAYGFLNLAYWSVRKNIKTDISNVLVNPANVQEISRRLFICGIVTLIVGFVCLFLWTSAYSSLSNFILNASRIRSGKGKIYNRFAFVKQFVKILPLSIYALLSAFLYERPKGLRKIVYIVLIALSLVGNYYYFIASDARVTIIFTGLAVLSISLRHRKKSSIIGYLTIAAVIGFVLLEATMLADAFTYYVRYGEWKSVNSGFINNLTKEFRFILSSDMRVAKAWISGDLKIQIGNDLINSLTSWIPDRFLPFSVPDTLWRYNTKMYGEFTGATSPTSLLSTSIYEFGLIGVIIFPLCFGFVIGYIEKLLWSNRTVVYADVYYGLLVGLSVQMVSHNQISTFVVSLFPAFLFWLVSIVVELINKKKKIVVEEAASGEVLEVPAKDQDADGNVEEERGGGQQFIVDPNGFIAPKDIDEG